MAREHWSVPIRRDEVPETGKHVELAADAATRALVARDAAVDAVDELAATFDLTRDGERLHALGRVRATIRQTCVVTLEPVVSEIDEPIDVSFVPGEVAATAAVADDSEDAPEPLRDGAVDLGALATEFLILGVDPYPRKPGVTFEPPAAVDSGASPFAALAALKNAGKVKD